MKLSKKLVAAVATLTMTGVAGLMAAAPASADPHGPDFVETPLAGDIFFFNKPVNLETATPADYAYTGTGLTADTNWLGFGVDAVCPEGSTNLRPIYRLPSAAPQQEWYEGQVAPQTWETDSQGRLYSIDNNQGFSIPAIHAYLAQKPNRTGQIQFGLICMGDRGEEFGLFTKMIDATAEETAPVVTWSLDAPEAAATTTTLAAAPASVTEGQEVTLTASVTPATATGNVSFKAGSVDLGSVALVNGVATLKTTAVPAGNQTVTASYAGVPAAFAASSATAAVTVVPEPVATTTTLDVSAAGDAAYSQVTLRSTVSAARGTANGTVKFFDGATLIGQTPCVNGVVADYVTNGLGAGTHSLKASFVGTAPFTGSESAPAELTFVAVGASAPGDGSTYNVTVSIPAGAISITTPYTEATPLALPEAVLDEGKATYATSAAVSGIEIKDTRAGNLGFTAQIIVGAFSNGTSAFDGQYASFTGVTADQIDGNALQASDVVVSDNASLAAPATFASYAQGKSIGSVKFHGTFGLSNVPTSVTPGQYASLVTFTAL